MTEKWTTTTVTGGDNTRKFASAVLHRTDNGIGRARTEPIYPDRTNERQDTYFRNRKIMPVYLRVATNLFPEIPARFVRKVAPLPQEIGASAVFS